MPDAEHEAQRLADQRSDDLATINRRELARARALGRKEAEDESFRADTKAHFAVINGSIDRTADVVAELVGEVREIRSEIRERDRVNEALVAAAAGHGAKKLTRFQSLGLAVLALSAVASLAVAVAQALGH